MDTLTQLLSQFNPDSPLLDALTSLLTLATAPPEPDSLFRHQKLALLQAARQLSCAAQAHALSQWAAPGPDTLLHQGRRFERTARAPRTYLGLDGPVRVERDLYRCRETGETLCPFELAVGIVEGALTPAAAHLELMSAACDDYRMAEQLHRAACVLPRSKSAMQRDVEAMGERLASELDTLEAARRDVLEPLDGVHSLSVSVDRTGLPFEEPTKRGPGRPRKGAPKKPCEVMHRQVYCASLTLHDESGEALHTQRFAGLPGEGDEVVKQARACFETLRAQDPEAKLVHLCDGAEEMQRRAAEILAGEEVEERLIDAWHALGYVHRAFSAAGWSGATCQEMGRRLVENKTGVKEVLTRLRTLQLEHRLEAVDEAVRYLANHREQMGYARAREKGLPIGSGAVEATCKCVVGVRFKRSGARWKAGGARPLLHTRAWLTSGEVVWKAVSEAFLDTYVMQLAA